MRYGRNMGVRSLPHLLLKYSSIPRIADIRCDVTIQARHICRRGQVYHAHINVHACATVTVVATYTLTDFSRKQNNPQNKPTHQQSKEGRRSSESLRVSIKRTLLAEPISEDKQQHWNKSSQKYSVTSGVKLLDRAERGTYVSRATSLWSCHRPD